MNLENIKESIVTNVYHIPAGKKVPLHKHPKHDEVSTASKERALEYWKIGK